MMSLHRSMHSSQMYTVGPAISLRTSSWLFPQNEQTRFPDPCSPCFAIEPPVNSPLLLYRTFRSDCHHIVNQAILLRLFAGHEHIAIRVFLDFLQALPGMLHQYIIQFFAHPENFTRLNIHVGRLPLKTTERLMDHDARMRQSEPLRFGTGGQQNGAHTSGLTDAYS